MIHRVLIGVLLASTLYAIEHETTFENSNFTFRAPLDGSAKQVYYNYNRFRISEHIYQGDWFLTAIGDVENMLGRSIINSTSYQAGSVIGSDTPFLTRTNPYNYGEGEIRAQLYRLYGGYADAVHRLSFGLQKVSMGVGRIWSPTDLFNPRNPLALELDEVYGVFSLAYTYALSDLSEIMVVTAQREDESFKYAGRFKGYLDIADVALNVISADDVSMVGYELEGELLGTGIELRSEGGWFKDKRHDKMFFQGIIGAEYAFENSLTLTGEWLHSSKTFKIESPAIAYDLPRLSDQAGLSVGGEFDALLSGTLMGIVNGDDGSFYLSPALSYSLDDDMTLALGAMLYGGKNDSAFGDYGQSYYLNVKVTF